VIGTSTEHCISSGIYYGTLGAIEGLLTRMVAELGQAPVIVATGGDALLLAENCPLVGVIDEDLIIHGLRLLAERGQTANMA
jgi:type III pantothenate kinase